MCLNCLFCWTTSTVTVWELRYLKSPDFTVQLVIRPRGPDYGFWERKKKSQLLNELDNQSNERNRSPGGLVANLPSSGSLWRFSYKRCSLTVSDSRPTASFRSLEKNWEVGSIFSQTATNSFETDRLDAQSMHLFFSSSSVVEKKCFELWRLFRMRRKCKARMTTIVALLPPRGPRAHNNRFVQITQWFLNVEECLSLFKLKVNIHNALSFLQ